MTNFNGYITVKKASEVLGVSVMTLRRWDASGKLKAKRHPLNKYRLYKKDQVKDILTRIK